MLSVAVSILDLEKILGISESLITDTLYVVCTP